MAWGVRLISRSSLSLSSWRPCWVTGASRARPSSPPELECWGVGAAEQLCSFLLHHADFNFFILQVFGQIDEASSSKESPFLGIARCRQTASGGQEEQQEGENCSYLSAALCPTDSSSMLDIISDLSQRN